MTKFSSGITALVHRESNVIYTLDHTALEQHIRETWSENRNP